MILEKTLRLSSNYSRKLYEEISQMSFCTDKFTSRYRPSINQLIKSIKASAYHFISHFRVVNAIKMPFHCNLCVRLYLYVFACARLCVWLCGYNNCLFDFVKFSILAAQFLFGFLGKQNLKGGFCVFGFWFHNAFWL